MRDINPSTVVFVLTAGNLRLDKNIGFRAFGVFVSNYTAQWVYLADPNAFIPPYTEKVIGLAGTLTADAQFLAPPGQTQPPSIAKQTCSLEYTSKLVAATGGNVGAARAVWYDRNPTTHGQRFVVSAAPHALVTRWSYTVPAGRKAFIQSALSVLLRDAAAGAAGYTTCDVSAYMNGGTEFVNFARSIFLNVAVDTRDTALASQMGAMSASDVFQGQTSDGSTGGTVLFDLSGSYVEFDA